MANIPVTRVFKVLSPAAWALAEGVGAVVPAGVDLADGYIHLSGADQVGGTLARYFGAFRVVTLVAFEAAALGPDLRWEPSTGGALYPHLYGPLETRHAVQAWTLVRGSDGFTLPDDIA
jgi:uncharacterized protein (DUF952 family)